MAAVWALGVVGIVVLVAAQYLSGTYAYFTDGETSSGNQLAAIALDFTAVGDGEIYTFEDGQLIGDDDGSVVTMVMLEPDSDPVPL